MKVCRKCKSLKPLYEFPVAKRNYDGYDTHCKYCRNLVNKIYRGNRSEKARLIAKERRKKSYMADRENVLRYKKVYHDAHKEEKTVYDRQYRLTHKENIKQYKKEWEEINNDRLDIKLKRNLRRRLNHVIKDGTKSTSTMNLLGCAITELINHLSLQFKDGMSWENYGVNGWHIDHIRPCSSFDLTLPEQQKECFNYKNLQPRWWYENLRKAAKWKKINE